MSRYANGSSKMSTQFGTPRHSAKPESKPPTKLVMHELNRTGDTPFVFDIENPEDIERAKQFFDNKISGGFSAYYVDPFDCQDFEMNEFDPAAGRIIFTPPVKAGYPSPPED